MDIVIDLCCEVLIHVEHIECAIKSAVYFMGIVIVRVVFIAFIFIELHLLLS